MNDPVSGAKKVKPSPLNIQQYKIGSWCVYGRSAEKAKSNAYVPALFYGDVDESL